MLGYKSQLPALTQTGQSPAPPGLGLLSDALGLRGGVLARGSLPGSQGFFQVPAWGSPLSAPSQVCLGLASEAAFERYTP